MIIGIDISQTLFGTGVGNWVSYLTQEVIKQNQNDSFVLFFSSLRGKVPADLEALTKSHKNVQLKTFPFPPTLLDLLWNTLHIVPIEWLIGKVDVFLTSDWTEPPVITAKKVTIIYDFIVYKYPEESHNMTSFNVKNLILKPNIVAVQKRKLQWVKKEVTKILCISESTKKDAEEILKIDPNRLEVIYPGVNL
jgi:glycosyltransferase involved in cell wall biosynthesis